LRDAAILDDLVARATAQYIVMLSGKYHLNASAGVMGPIAIPKEREIDRLVIQHGVPPPGIAYRQCRSRRRERRLPPSEITPPFGQLELT